MGSVFIEHGDLKYIMKSIKYHLAVAIAMASAVLATSALAGPPPNWPPNFPTVVKSKEDAVKYPKEKVLISFLNKLNPKTYHFDSMEFQLTFPNNRSFIYYLKNLGVNASNKFIPINILKSLIKEADTEFTVTYKIFFGIMKRI